MASEQEKFAIKSAAKGAFVRPSTKFHNKIGDPQFPAEAGRYRLYVSYACPWAHRCYIVLKMKGLEDVISLTVTGYKLENLSKSMESENYDYPSYKGWDFIPTEDKSSVFYEPNGFKYIDELYEYGAKGYREEYRNMKRRPIYSVPVLLDEKQKKIVSNESSEIIVMLNDKFNHIAKNPSLDLNPEHLRDKMAKVDAIVYPKINDGVYRCGFSRSQEAYEQAYHDHWKGMDEIEEILSKNRFLCGDQMTLSDIRLFVTLIRYDPVYYGHFKTSRNKITELSNMLGFVRDIFKDENIQETTNMEFIIKHYYESQRGVNPTGIWPIGYFEKGALDYLRQPSGREKLIGKK